jgi:hypothetical protein
MNAKTLIGRWLWLFRRPSRPCQTKPIRAGAGADAGWGTGTNKPNFRRDLVGRSLGARRSRAVVQTKPNLGRTGHLGDASGRYIMRNKANHSIADWGRTPGRMRALPPAAGRLRQTNPILQLRIVDCAPTCGGTPFAAAWRGAGCTNKANLRPSGRPDGLESAPDAQRRCGHRMPATPSDGPAAGQLHVAIVHIRGTGILPVRLCGIGIPSASSGQALPMIHGLEAHATSVCRPHPPTARGR